MVAKRFILNEKYFRKRGFFYLDHDLLYEKGQYISPQVNYSFSNYLPSLELTSPVCLCQDDDVAAVNEGKLSIHRLKRSLDDPHGREITTLKMEIQQIMKGECNNMYPLALNEIKLVKL